MNRLKVISLLLSIAVAFGAVAAQSTSGMSDDARAALRQGQVAAARAMATYDRHFPDQPLWREAIAHGQEARRLAPGRLEPLRFLAQVYTTTQWHARAWQAWQAYREAGGELDAQARRDMVESGVWLGYDRYQAGDLEVAAQYFEAAHELQPENTQATGWLGRVYFELGRPEDAVPLLQQAVRALPSVDLFARYLDRAEHQQAYGVAASNAFFEASEARSEGRLEEALDAYLRAVEANPGFVEAVRAAAEVHMDLGRPQAAIPLWERVVASEPDDESAAFFLELARDQAEYGVAAVDAWRRGRSQLQAGQPEAAAASLAEATQANPAIAEVWALRATALEELGDLEGAEEAWQRAVALAPGDQTYASALALVQERLAPPVAEVEQEPAPEPTEEEAAAPAPTEEEAAAPAPPPAGAPEDQAATPTEEPVQETTAPEPTEEEAAAPAPEPPPSAAAPEPAPPEDAPEPAVERSVGVFVLLDAALQLGRGAGGEVSAFRFVPGRVEMIPDLTQPVNYAGGTLVQRLEVRAKPTDLPVQVQLCLVPTDITRRPACTDAEELEFVEPGVYLSSQPVPSLWQYDNVSWSDGLSSLMVVVKDGEGNPVDGSYPLRENFAGAPDLGLYYPMEVAYTVVLVPEGGEFVGWEAQ